MSPLTPEEQWIFDSETNSLLSEIYANRDGFTTEFVTPEMWAEEFNQLPASVRLESRYDPNEGVSGFIDAKHPWRKKVVCCFTPGGCNAWLIDGPPKPG